MDMLSDKTVLVTGAARGIGKEIALTFARQGANVVGWDLDLEGLQKMVQEVREIGPQAAAFKCDISNFREVSTVLEKVLEKFPVLDILVNNAGVTRDNLILRMSEEDWDFVLKVNLKGAFNCSKAVAKYMVKARSGKIINIASIIGLMGNAGQSNYAASKAGLIALTKSLAKELGRRNITVNAIAPGFIKTKMTASLPEEVKNQMLKNIALAEFGETSDVANVALFLASSWSDYITGQVIVVDGGMLM